MDGPAKMELAGLIPKGQAQLPGQTSSRIALFLRRAATNRYGARAFSTLEGYAGRNWRNGVGFTCKVRENAQPPSRFSSEIGTKADAKQQTWASVRACDSFPVVCSRCGGSTALRAAVGG